MNRNYLICMENGCRRCDLSSRMIKEDCKYAVLHLLKDNENGLIQRKRRSGKTYELARNMIEIANNGFTTMLIVKHCSFTRVVLKYVRNYLKSQNIDIDRIRNNMIVLNSGGIIMIGSSANILKGLRNVYIFTDEVTPNELEKMEETFHGNIFFKGYYT